MIKWIISSTFIIMTLKTYNIICKIPSTWLYHHYNERVDYFRRLNKRLKPGGIVFIGDSLTEHFMVSEFFSEHYVINRGISGDTTYGVLCRLKESAFDLKPKKIFLLIGINDVGNEKDPGYIINNTKLIIKKFKNKLPKTKIYVQSIYPVYKDVNNRIKKKIVGNRDNKQIQIINRQLYRLSRKYNCTYIDMNKKLKDNRGQLKYECTIEGLHLSPRGYEIIARELEKYL
ncbi:SGNH/GDSL hydrolase family protein [Vallitalea sediminicola]